MNKKSLLSALVITFLSLTGCKELEPILDQVGPVLQQQGGQSSSAFSTEQLVEAIKQALTQGVGDSVNQLGATNGFSLSKLYRIPIPDSLDKPASVLRQLGQGKRVDEFENRLNLAAEQSVARAMPIFSSAVRGMSVSDALGIMKGADNAATVYFRDRTESSLRAEFMPIIQKATGQSGLTSSYKELSNKIATYVPQYKSRLVDIDDYVLERATNSLFDRIAEEEKLIRQDPAKRTTQLMQSVFGHFAGK